MRGLVRRDGWEKCSTWWWLMKLVDYRDRLEWSWFVILRCPWGQEVGRSPLSRSYSCNFCLFRGPRCIGLNSVDLAGSPIGLASASAFRLPVSLAVSMSRSIVTRALGSRGDGRADLAAKSGEGSRRGGMRRDGWRGKSSRKELSMAIEPACSMHAPLHLRSLTQRQSSMGGVNSEEGEEGFMIKEEQRAEAGQGWGGQRGGRAHEHGRPESARPRELRRKRGVSSLIVARSPILRCHTRKQPSVFPAGPAKTFPVSLVDKSPSSGPTFFRPA